MLSRLLSQFRQRSPVSDTPLRLNARQSSEHDVHVQQWRAHLRDANRAVCTHLGRDEQIVRPRPLVVEVRDSVLIELPASGKRPAMVMELLRRRIDGVRHGRLDLAMGYSADPGTMNHLSTDYLELPTLLELERFLGRIAARQPGRPEKNAAVRSLADSVLLEIETRRDMEWKAMQARTSAWFAFYSGRAALPSDAVHGTINDHLGALSAGARACCRAL